MVSRGTSQHRSGALAAALLMGLVAVAAAAAPGAGLTARPLIAVVYA